MRAEKVVVALLKADATVTGIVGTKIFFAVAEEQIAAPLVVYRKQSATRIQASISPRLNAVDALIDVMCIGRTGDELLQLGEAVRAALFNRIGDNVAGTGVKVFRLEIDGEAEQQYSPDLREFSQIWTFRVQHKEP